EAVGAALSTRHPGSSARGLDDGPNLVTTGRHACLPNPRPALRSVPAAVPAVPVALPGELGRRELRAGHAVLRSPAPSAAPAGLHRLRDGRLAAEPSDGRRQYEPDPAERGQRRGRAGRVLPARVP